MLSPQTEHPPSGTSGHPCPGATVGEVGLGGYDALGVGKDRVGNGVPPGRLFEGRSGILPPVGVWPDPVLGGPYGLDDGASVHRLQADPDVDLDQDPLMLVGLDVIDGAPVTVGSHVGHGVIVGTGENVGYSFLYLSFALLYSSG